MPSCPLQSCRFNSAFRFTPVVVMGAMPPVAEVISTVTPWPVAIARAVPLAHHAEGPARRAGNRDSSRCPGPAARPHRPRRSASRPASARASRSALWICREPPSLSRPEPGAQQMRMAPCPPPERPGGHRHRGSARGSPAARAHSFFSRRFRVVQQLQTDPLRAHDDFVANGQLLARSAREVEDDLVGEAAGLAGKPRRARPAPRRSSRRPRCPRRTGC